MAACCPSEAEARTWPAWKPETVNTHLRHIFREVGLRSRVELARPVIENSVR
jgi:hypothetical protein